MRVVINCPSGKSHLLQLAGDISVHDLKLRMQDIEGIPVAQQEIIFGGQGLRDECSLSEYQIQEYTLADEVVLYLQKVIAAPLHIFLSGHQARSRIVTEIVEEQMLLDDVQNLLVSRNLASKFEPGMQPVVKRQDGTTVLLDIDIHVHSIDHLKGLIKESEGCSPEKLLFLQSHDGALHIQFSPCAAAHENSHSVYKRSGAPQQLMMKKPYIEGQPLPDVVKDLCVHP